MLARGKGKKKGSNRSKKITSRPAVLYSATTVTTYTRQYPYLVVNSVPKAPLIQFTIRKEFPETWIWNDINSSNARFV